MNIYVVINDYGIETYTRSGLILYANKILFKKEPNAKCLRTTKQAIEFFNSIGASVTHTELLKG